MFPVTNQQQQRYIEDVGSEFYSEVYYLARRFGKYSDLNGWFQLPGPYRFYSPQARSKTPPTDLHMRVVELVQEALVHVCMAFKEDASFQAHVFQFLLKADDNPHWDMNRSFIVETAKQLERYVKENADELGFVHKQNTTE